MSADFARTPKGRLAGVIFWSRWLQLPIYLGLIVVQGVYAWKFLSQLYKLLANLTSLTEIEIMLTVLGLIDVVMIANLLIIIVFAGYENIVSKINTSDTEDRPSWMGHVGFADLKMKLIGSIVAISGIELLKAFMHVQNYTNDQLAWKVGLHMTFVVSGVLFAVMDKLGGKHHSNDE